MVIEKGTKISAEIFYFLIGKVPESMAKLHFYEIIEKNVENLVITRTADEFDDKLWTHFVLIRENARV
jgi:hypothetical protein